jgi:hypothetical protein
MVSIVTNQYPDTVLPQVTSDIDVSNSQNTTIKIAHQHLYHAWAQMSLELSKIPCEVVIYLKDDMPYKNILVNGETSMLLRVHEYAPQKNIRGIMKNENGMLDVIDVPEHPVFNCYTGIRVHMSCIKGLEIRHVRKILYLETQESDLSPIDWFVLDDSDSVSCWLWSVCKKKHFKNGKRQGLLDTIYAMGMMNSENFQICNT